jgi:hypothetical protein
MQLLETWHVELFVSPTLCRDERFAAAAQVEADLRRAIRAALSSDALASGLRIELRR